MKAVFDTKPSSVYDDEITERYHFPRRYAAIVAASAGDWVVLRRPRADGGNLAYFAVARVIAVEPDPVSAALSYARLAEFLSFDVPVPWTTNGRYAESALRQLSRPQVGVFLRGRSVRPLDDEDFVAIVSAGLRDTIDPANARRYGLDPVSLDIAAFQADVPLGERVWRIEAALTNRIVRDASFRRTVCVAYDDRCAVSRLRIINGGGRSEVQAAHIWPVTDGGPDVVQNGIALSATIHWLFDRHLISLTDDYRILVAHNRVPSELQTLFGEQSKTIHLPTDRSAWPHPSFLARHREKFFRRLIFYPSLFWPIAKIRGNGAAEMLALRAATQLFLAAFHFDFGSQPSIVLLRIAAGADRL
ncbi:MAG: HNH endonuclease [Sphingomonas sp.]